MGDVDPRRDIEIIETELVLADLETVEKAANRIGRQAKAGEPEVKAQLALLERVMPHLAAGRPARTLALDSTESQRLRPFPLLTLRPVLYVANVDERSLAALDRNPHVATVAQIAEAEGAELVPLCAQLESELLELEDAERVEMLRELGLEEAGLDRLIRAGYHLLGLHTFFTAGPKEVRAWTIPAGATASRAAGTIHTDFERGFIRAEIIALDDFLRLGEQGAKESGLRRSEGRDYVLRDGEVVHFLFNV
jgi:GTP-binding protein YchF